MNRTDRLLAIVLELQSQGWQRAEDLAARFQITKRTVYRDMQALSEAGVPVVAVPGQGYSLAPGYFLPPLAFTPRRWRRRSWSAGCIRLSRWGRRRWPPPATG